MKKEYIKPYLAVESFQLNAAIATACSAEYITGTNEKKTAIHYGEDSCTLIEELGISYIGNACGTDIVNVTDDDYFCYHGPIDPYAMFIKS